jgi:hypothetical protein
MVSARSGTLVRWLALGVLALLVVALPAAGSRGGDSGVNAALAEKLRLPYFTPKNLSPRLREVIERRDSAHVGLSRRAVGAGAPVFNNDGFGLPQNEESVTVCRTNRNFVLEGTNDYRGLLDEAGNFTGWHFSNTGGASLTNEGLLPPAALISDPTNEVPSGGDPVMVAAGGCALYGGGLAYDPVDPFHNVNGVQVAKSDPATLASCDTASNPANPACWPVSRLVAEGASHPDCSPASSPCHFLDKPWYDVGVSGEAGEVVWVTYSDFVVDDTAPLGFSSASIKAVRCDSSLTTCTSPIDISTVDEDVQFSDVTIGPDGRTYVTWARIDGELEQLAQTFTIKVRIAEPGSTTFGPEKVVAVEELPIPFGGFLNANDFRIATYPKNAVALVGGAPRIFVVWDACRFRPLDSVCEEAHIKLAWSDDSGDTWSAPKEVSRGGNNYFPSIDWDDEPAQGDLALTWFSNRRDAQFDNRQDVEFATVSANNPAAVRNRRILNTRMNESEADPLLGGFFIGDYIEVTAFRERAWVGFNANYRQVQLLGEGVPVPQQDNYLDRVRFSE